MSCTTAKAPPTHLNTSTPSCIGRWHARTNWPIPTNAELFSYFSQYHPCPRNTLCLNCTAQWPVRAAIVRSTCVGVGPPSFPRPTLRSPGTVPARWLRRAVPPKEVLRPFEFVKCHHDHRPRIAKHSRFVPGLLSPPPDRFATPTKHAPD
jgi:hypothetical protein